MAGENDFLAFSTSGSANVESQSAWLTDPVVGNGVQSGIASSSQANKAWRQSSVIANLIGQFIANTSISGTFLTALDNANPTQLMTNFIAALTAFINNTPLNFNVYGPGSYNLTAPSAYLKVRVWGGGGGGGSGNGGCGGGGSGGAYAEGVLQTTVGAVLTIVVGSGGATDTSGTSSSISGGSVTVTANGGGGGGGGVPSSYSPSIGVSPPGTATFSGGYAQRGGEGHIGDAFTNSGRSGAGGGCFGGPGAAERVLGVGSGVGNGGTLPGVAGAGGVLGGSGGIGSNGLVIIEWL